MDWQRFLRLISLCSHDPGSKPNLDSIRSSNIDDTLTHFKECSELFQDLLNILRECSSVHECASQYPQAGDILTRASLNPILAADETICKLIIQCLMEYTKLWSAPDVPLHEQDASKLWCLTRMRRILHRPRITHPELRHLIEEVRVAIESNHSSLEPGKLYELSNYCIPLMRNPTADPIIFLLIELACQAAKRADVPDVDGYTLSSSFIDCLMERFLDTHRAWDTQLEIELWSICTKCVEYELLNVLGVAFAHNQYVWNTEKELHQALYTNHTLKQGFLNATITSPYIYKRAFSVMARMTVSSMDWRCIQLFETIHNMLLARTSSSKEIDAPQDTIPPQYHDNGLQHLDIADYFPSRLQPLVALCKNNGPLVNMNQVLQQCLFEQRGEYQESRNEAWLFLMMSGTMLSLIASHAINPVQEDETNAAVRLLSWLSCPSDDERLDQTEQGLLRWLDTIYRHKADLKAKTECLRYAKDNVFNGNLNCWYHCLFWILQPQSLEDVWELLLCVVDGDSLLVHTMVWHLSWHHCPLHTSITKELIHRLLRAQHTAL